MLMFLRTLALHILATHVHLNGMLGHFLILVCQLTLGLLQHNKDTALVINRVLLLEFGPYDGFIMRRQCPLNNSSCILINM